MSKYRYRIAKEGDQGWLTIRKQRKGVVGLLMENWFWSFVGQADSIEYAKKQIEIEKQSYENPKIEILEVIE